MAHLRNVRSHLRFLRDNCRINIADNITLLFNQFAHMLQQFDTGNSFVSRIRVRKVLADITKSSSAKQRIHYSVQHDICI